MLRIIEMKFRGADGVSRVERGHPMVALVPSLVPLARIDAEDRVWAVFANQLRRLAAQRLRLGVFQLAVVITQPDDVLLRDADDLHRRFLFVLSVSPQ